MQTNENITAETIEPSEALPVRYRSISANAIISLALGFFSILAIFHWVFWVIPAVSVWLATRALKQIKHAPTEYTGEGFARAGIAVALVLWLLGAYLQHYIQQHSIPAGYKPITFDYLQPAFNSSDIIPQAAFDLEPNTNDPDKRVFISGYIYPGRRSINIREFVLVPTLSHCQYCTQQMKSTEMVQIKFTGDLKIDYTTQPVKVGGKLHIDRDQIFNPFGGLPYQIEADYLQE